MLPKEITDYLAANRSRHMEELFELLRYPSVSSQSERKADSLACAERVAGHLRDLGFEAELRPWRQRPVLIARSRAAAGSDRTVLLYGHYDVQPAAPTTTRASSSPTSRLSRRSSERAGGCR